MNAIRKRAITDEGNRKGLLSQLVKRRNNFFNDIFSLLDGIKLVNNQIYKNRLLS